MQPFRSIPANKRRLAGGRTVWLVLMGIVVALGVWIGFHYSQPPSSQPKTSVHQTDEAGNRSAFSGTAGTNETSHAMEALRLINRWQTLHPAYHLRIEASGDTLQEEADLFLYPSDSEQDREWRLEVRLLKPVQARYILGQHDDQVIAFFPESKTFSRLPETEELLQKTLRLVPGDPEAEEMLRVLAKDADLIEHEQMSELVLHIDPSELPLVSFQAAITAHLYFNSDGQVLKVVQRLDEYEKTSRYIYLTFDPERVAAAAPQLPPIPDHVEVKNFNDALIDNLRTLNQPVNKVIL